MFTGIIKGTAVVKNTEWIKGNIRLSIITNNTAILEDYNVGDSLAINGVCLTAISIENATVSFDVMEATFNRTALKYLKLNQLVNLERALKVDSRLDGHFVLGHVDGIAELVNQTKKEGSTYFEFKASNELMAEIVPRGSITIDGISLTVQNMTEETFTVSIVPYTIENTNLNQLAMGDFVNIETDILGKYALKKA